MDSTGDWAAALPQYFPVSVLMAREPVIGNPWIDTRWVTVGVVAGRADPGRRLIRTEADREEYLFGGFEVALHRDECESYYHNIKAPRPECYVLLQAEADDDGGELVPVRISLSFDEAHAYIEGEDTELHVVDMPPELYRWVEAYVLAHYVPTPRKKRKRTDWRKGRP